jgi:hypothetical protein
MALACGKSSGIAFYPFKWWDLTSLVDFISMTIRPSPMIAYTSYPELVRQ